MNPFQPQRGILTAMNHSIRLIFKEYVQSSVIKINVPNGSRDGDFENLKLGLPFLPVHMYKFGQYVRFRTTHSADAMPKS